MFPLWLGFCAVIFIETILKRDFSGLVKYILLFCTGILIITIPVILYLKVNNAIADYIQQNFITSSLRGLTGFSFMAFIGYSLAFILMVIFHAVIRRNFDHYNMTLTPFLISAFTFFINEIFKYFNYIKNNKLCFALFLCILFSSPLAMGFGRTYFSFRDTSRKNDIITGKTIDEYTIEEDKIIFLGFPSRIYLFTQRNTASRYIYQLSGVDNEPDAQNEFLTDILYRNKPVIIVVENRDGRYDYLPKWYAPIYDMIKTEYQMITDKNGYFLFKRTQTGGTY